jgi:nucleoside-diphosphate-sugar epimerase
MKQHKQQRVPLGAAWMDLTGKRVLVTGADGFIGSHLVEELVQLGCDVKAFAYYNAFGSAGWLDYMSKSIRNEVEVVLGDIRDGYAVNQSLRHRDVVFHLAALIGIPYSYVAPKSYVDTNICGTMNVLQAVREHELEKVIHTSTSEVYGTARFVPMTEDHPLHPQSPYAATKISADELALSFFHSFQIFGSFASSCATLANHRRHLYKIERRPHRKTHSQNDR